MESSVIKRTLHDRVSVIMMILFGSLLIGCGVMSLLIYQGTTRTQKFFTSEVLSSTIKEVNDQYEINNKLTKIMNNNSYSLKNAYVELNPYGNSPLSGVIIFQTKDEEQIRLYINNKYVTTIEATKKHVIPIYGLYEDYENVIRIEGSNETQEYTIKTENSNINYPLKNKEIDYYNGITFISSDNITGYDSDKKLRFYLTGNYKNDIDFLPNGHMVLGVSESNYNNNYIGIIEMDYLGKIYNYYALPNGYSHELQVLSNGNIMISGYDKGIYGDKNILYEIDPRTGNKVNEIDVSKITYSLYEKLIIDDFYYNESNKEITISFVGVEKILVMNDSKSAWVNKKEIHDKRFTIDNKLYRVYQNNLYDEVTPNVSINSIKEYNKIDKENLDETSYRKIDLDKSETWINKAEFNRNSFSTDYIFDYNDKVDLYLVNKAGKIYVLHYKENNSMYQGKVYNVTLPVGQYALFIKLNDRLYNTNKVYQF